MDGEATLFPRPVARTPKRSGLVIDDFSLFGDYWH